MTIESIDWKIRKINAHGGQGRELLAQLDSDPNLLDEVRTMMAGPIRIIIHEQETKVQKLEQLKALLLSWEKEMQRERR